MPTRFIRCEHLHGVFAVTRLSRMTRRPVRLPCLTPQARPTGPPERWLGATLELFVAEKGRVGNWRWHWSGSERRMHRQVPPGECWSGTHGRGEWTQHGKPCPVAWHAPTDSPRGSELAPDLIRCRAGRVAERPAVPVRPGNAGGGKGPQVRSNAQREKGLGSGLGL